MLRPYQIGCKKCGGVITIDPRKSSDRFEIRIKDAKTEERSGRMEIHCKKCNRPVAVVEVREA
jgi:hypothetical protein